MAAQKGAGEQKADLSHYLSEAGLSQILMTWQETMEGQRVEAPQRLLVNPWVKPRDVILYGFGRIGRLLMRLLIEKMGSGLKLMVRAIVVRPKKGISKACKSLSVLSRSPGSTHNAFRKPSIASHLLLVFVFPRSLNHS